MRGKLVGASVVLSLVLGFSPAAFAGADVDCEHLGALAVAAEKARKSFRFRTYDNRRLVALTLAECAYRKEADPALAAAIGDRRFARLSAAERRRTLSAAGLNAWRLDRNAHALELFRRAIAADPGDPDDWYRRSLLERAQGDDAAAADSLIHLIEHWPELLDNLDDGHIFPLIYRLEPRSPVRLNLLQALLDANWRRKGQGASAAWYELALMRIDRGETDAARMAVRRVSGPIELAKLRADKRFDAIVDRDAIAFNVENAAQRETDLYRSLAASQPDSLEWQMQLGYSLLTQGRDEEALLQSGRVIASIAEAPKDRPAYADLGDEVWVMNSRAIALRRLGRYDEALLELQRASRLNEDGVANVSQVLNLGDYYASLGRADEALAAAARAGDDISGYGRMVQTLVRLRAAVQKQDAAGAENALAYLREHRKDGETLLLSGLIYAERMDEAERILLELLASVSGREDVLQWLQKFREAEPLPGDRVWRARKAELIARRRVQEAVDKVGRIERYGIFGANEMN
ncbi:tetratricopeptide repeat protein [Lysobacter sp. CCNWLW3]|uniref:tetratricopeptide repeat protein n=1 Tax=unclassified Lysobacter TaxID=2635362 RepID=UPI002FD0FBE7